MGSQKSKSKQNCQLKKDSNNIDSFIQYAFLEVEYAQYAYVHIPELFKKRQNKKLSYYDQCMIDKEILETMRDGEYAKGLNFLDYISERIQLFWSIRDNTIPEDEKDDGEEEFVRPQFFFMHEGDAIEMFKQ